MDTMTKFNPSHITFSIIFVVVFLTGCTTDHLIKTKSYHVELGQCWDEISQAKGNMQQLNDRLNREISDYQIIIEELLVSRAKTLELTEGISQYINQNRAIPPAVLEDLNIRMKKGFEFEGKLSRSIARNECWFQASNERMEEKGDTALAEDVRLKGLMLALSGTLTLYDSYMMTVSVLNEHDRIRRFLNQSDIGYGIQQDQIKAVTDAVHDLSNLLFVREEIAFYEKNIVKYRQRFENDKMSAYLILLIKQSPSYPKLKNMSFNEVATQREKVRQTEVADNFAELNRSAINGVSQFFGNLVGLVEERKGKLYGNKQIEAYLSKQLVAGDILLEKTPFRLTDKMIPGHWGHAAIWVGSEQELKKLGIWQHKVISKYHKQIQSGHAVVEALRSDVTMNTLAHFMNIDDIAIIRKRKISDKERGNVIIRTLRQVGKEYDFNYDVETTDKIVCSQLVYLAYTDISWPTDKVAGRYTISPDNVGFKAVNNGPLKLVRFYHDGKRIDGNASVLMQKLMEVD